MPFEWIGKKIIVTGAGGFIGSHLVEVLAAKGAVVRALVHYRSSTGIGNLAFISPEIRRDIEIIAGDVRDPFAMQRLIGGSEMVFHLAALISIPYSYIAPSEFVATNTVGTLNVLEACRTVGVGRLIHTSTSEVYGTARYVPIDECHPLQGQSPYSASKIGADMLAESFYRSFDLPVVTVRPFNTFGPRQSQRAVIPTIAAQLLCGANTLKLGSTTPVRDFIFVLDTVQGFIKAAEAENVAGEVVQLGSKQGFSITEVAELMMRLVGRTVPIVTEEVRIRPEKSEVMRLEGDNTKAKNQIGWSPKYSLEEGLRDTLAFVESHLDLFRARVTSYTI